MEAAVINFTPLYGAEGDTDALACVLRIGGEVLLLDCGWTASFDEELLQPLKEIVPDLTAVLITSSSLEHCGALPYAVGKLGLSVPIYCTAPTITMGRLTLFEALRAVAPYKFDLFDLEDVRKAFASATALQFTQELVLGDETKVTVAAHLAGHVVGCALWHIRHETEDVLYAPAFNHTKEYTLPKSVVQGVAYKKKPVMIVSGRTGALSLPKRKERNLALSEAIMTALRGGGNVILPCDTAGRALELLFFLNALWERETERAKQAPKKSRKWAFPLMFVAREADSVLEAARTHLSFMSAAMQELFDDGAGENPFHLRHVTCVSDYSYIRQFLELQATSRKRGKRPLPFVCVAPDASLDTGMAQQLLLDMYEDPRSLLVLTGTQTRTAPTSLQTRELARLRGDELLLFRAQQKQRAHEAREEARVDKQVAVGVKRGSSEAELETEEEEASSSSDDDDQHLEVKASGRAGGMGAGLGGLAFHGRPMMSFTEGIHGADGNSAAHSSAYGMELHWRRMRRAFKKSRVMLFEEDNRGEAKMVGVGGGGPTGVKRELEVVVDPRQLTELAGGVQRDEPVKCVLRRVPLTVRCQTVHVPLPGLSDGQSLRTVVNRKNPSKIIVVGGAKTARQRLREGLKCTHVALPRNGQLVEITSELNVLRVGVSETLAAELETSMVKTDDGFQLGYVDACVVSAEHPFARAVDAVDARDRDLLQLVSWPVRRLVRREDVAELDRLRVRALQRGYLRSAAFLGQVAMSDVQARLQASDIGAKFIATAAESKEKALECAEGELEVSKPAEDSVRISGVLCRDYFSIRKLMYQVYKAV